VSIAASAYLFGGLCSLALAVAAQAVELSVSPATARYDEPVSIRVTGLLPGRRAVVRAGLVDAAGVRWSSSGTYYASTAGAIDIDTAASVAGSYTGVDGEGLFWSMTSMPLAAAEAITRDPRSAHFSRAPQLDSGKTQIYELSVSMNGRIVAERKVQRSFGVADVVRTPVRAGRLLGAYFAPRAGSPRAALLLIGGSRGGMEEPLAMLLAANGIAVFAQAWIHHEHLPRWPHNVPIEQFMEGLDWLRERSGQGRVALMGISWGTEAASLAAQRVPERVGALVLFVPAPMPTSGYDPGEANPTDVSKWSMAGRPVPFALPSFPRGPEDTAHLGRSYDRPLDVREEYLRSWFDPRHEQLLFDLRELRAPILLISAEADEVWPSETGASLLAAHLARAGFGFPVQHVCQPGATHLAYLPGVVQPMLDREFDPVLGTYLSWGGLRASSAAAARDSFDRIRRFLLESARRSVQERRSPPAPRRTDRDDELPVAR
jgi:pimeloyl-ACP methyl ester carboxylesterase